MIKMIACIDKNGAIGYQNRLLFKIPEDMEFFKNTTMGKSVLMGRKTFESIGEPLKGRINYVATSQKIPETKNLITNFDLDDLLLKFAESKETLFVIGGESMYKYALSYAEEIYLTIVDGSTQRADAFFPKFMEELYQKTILVTGSSKFRKFEIVKYSKLR